MQPRFALDVTGAIIDATSFVLPSADPYLLGVLNSAPMWFYLRSTCAVVGDVERRGRLRLERVYVERAPIPVAADSDRAAIAALAQKCIDAGGVGCEERAIDARVAALYGL